MARDLHQSFADPRQAEAAELTRFLLEVDRLPGIRAIQRAIAVALDPRPGQRLLDAGCGIGLEALRLAETHPDVSVTGLDRNAELLAIAARSTAGVEWVHADLMAVDVPSESFDAVRTERVLMYLADEAVDEIVRLVRPGGRLALFELDYGATILAPGHGGDVCGVVVERAQAALRAAVPQPWSGRRLPLLLAERGLRDVTAEPYAFSISASVWERIVHATLRDLDHGRPSVAAPGQRRRCGAAGRTGRPAAR
jgi:SAM-dependent methyltransferase